MSAEKRGYYKDSEISAETDFQKRIEMRLHNLNYTKGVSKRVVSAFTDLAEEVVKLKQQMWRHNIRF